MNTCTRYEGEEKGNTYLTCKIRDRWNKHETIKTQG